MALSWYVVAFSVGYRDACPSQGEIVRNRSLGDANHLLCCALLRLMARSRLRSRFGRPWYVLSSRFGLDCRFILLLGVDVDVGISN